MISTVHRIHRCTYTMTLCVYVSPVQGSRCEVYMGGSLGVESVQEKEEQAFVARVNTAKSVSFSY